MVSVVVIISFLSSSITAMGTSEVGAIFWLSHSLFLSLILAPLYMYVNFSLSLSHAAEAQRFDSISNDVFCENPSHGRWTCRWWCGRIRVFGDILSMTYI